MQKFRMIGLLAMSIVLQGCALWQAPDNKPEEISDPLESMNRFFFDINQRIDRHAALPVTDAYNENVPHRVRGSLHNLLDNLGGPVTVANNLLQAQFENAGVAAGRFLVNTTIGIAGIFDVATDWGMPARR